MKTSLPSPPTRSKQLGACRESQKRGRGVVINPDPQLAPTVWEVLQPRQVEQFRTADDYLSRSSLPAA
jgi:hypothetical protein